MPSKPVAIIMGSQSDWATMKHAAENADGRAGLEHVRHQSFGLLPTDLVCFVRQ